MFTYLTNNASFTDWSYGNTITITHTLDPLRQYLQLKHFKTKLNLTSFQKRNLFQQMILIMNVMNVIERPKD